MMKFSQKEKLKILSNVQNCTLKSQLKLRNNLRQKKKKKLFGCTPPTDPMFEAYPNLFFFFNSQPKNHKTYQEKTKNAEKSS